jgi:restriction system protein
MKDEVDVPGFQFFMTPFLQVLSDRKIKQIRTIKDEIIRLEKLTPEQCAVKLPSGGDTLVNNRIAWVRTYLYKAGLIQQVSRGNYLISDEGAKVLKEHPTSIDVKFLRSLEPFRQWMGSFGQPGKDENLSLNDGADTKTPQELLDSSFDSIMNDVAQELLDRVKKCPPDFFEKLVVDVLLAMGYGRVDQANGRVTKYSNDGGIDGIIKEDKLGLDKIYIQAKRWENTVPVSAITDFARSLLGKKSRKGVFITTSSFPKSAYEYVKTIDPTIALIDGPRLTRMMIENNIAVNKSKTYEIKRIDNGYFEI